MSRAYVQIEIRCSVKGYHECDFNVSVGEEFFAKKKYGARGNAFKVCNERGQLGHLEYKVVDPLWSLHSQIRCVVIGEPFNDPRGRWRTGGGINVPVKVMIRMPLHKAKKLKQALKNIAPGIEIKPCDTS